jgi:hypothetical protein
MASFIADDEISRGLIGVAIGGESNFWASSLDLTNEEKMPTELRHWCRWNNHFDKEMEFDMLKLDM